MKRIEALAQHLTNLLEKAVTELSNLPEDEQDRYASEILASLSADAEWDRLFASEASQKWLAGAAEEARRDVAGGRFREIECSAKSE
ncbi:MAG: hypothetical protein ACLPWS_19810 [Rhodomicrobium sp.]